MKSEVYCSKCGQIKPADAFYWYGVGTSIERYAWPCKQCFVELGRLKRSKQKGNADMYKCTRCGRTSLLRHTLRCEICRPLHVPAVEADGSAWVNPLVMTIGSLMSAPDTMPSESEPSGGSGGEFGGAGASGSWDSGGGSSDSGSSGSSSGGSD